MCSVHNSEWPSMHFMNILALLAYIEQKFIYEQTKVKNFFFLKEKFITANLLFFKLHMYILHTNEVGR